MPSELRKLVKSGMGGVKKGDPTFWQQRQSALESARAGLGPEWDSKIDARLGRVGEKLAPAEVPTTNGDSNPGHPTDPLGIEKRGGNPNASLPDWVSGFKKRFDRPGVVFGGNRGKRIAAIDGTWMNENKDKYAPPGIPPGENKGRLKK